MKNLLLLIAGISMSLLVADLAEAGSGKGTGKADGKGYGSGTVRFGSEVHSTEDITVWLLPEQQLSQLTDQTTKDQLVSMFGNGETIRPHGSGKTLRPKTGRYVALVVHSAYFGPAAGNTKLIQDSPTVTGFASTPVTVSKGSRQRVRVNATRLSSPSFSSARSTTFLVEPF